MEKNDRKHLQSLIDLHNKGLLHANFLTGDIADMVTVENFDEIMSSLPPSAERLVAQWIRRIPRDPNVETLEPLSDEICECFFQWLDRYDARSTDVT